MAHFITTEQQGMPKVYHDRPLLFYLDHDPSEKYDSANEYPQMVRNIRQKLLEHIAERDMEMDRFGIPMKARLE